MPATNALANSTSPYLLQHKHNPVQWMPWGDEAWDLAKRQNKLVIVSIGYSACHWCHVMEEETFEDPRAAAFMNEHFVCIKVDREERPDVDQVYMDAVQLMTQRGGWPLNCVSLPDGRPIWGGTYFPRAQWLRALEGVLGVWRDERGKVEDYAQHLALAVQGLHDTPMQPASPWDEEEHPNPSSLVDALRAKLNAWKSTWDPVHGGSLGAPKFPLPSQASFLMRWGVEMNDTSAQAHGVRTLVGLETGGIHDHVGGGFARYSVDERWHVPHFEKMLYDNAQLLAAFATAHQVNVRPEWHRAAEGIVGFLLRELNSPSGGFMSAMDADSDGEEGTYYVWRDEDVQSALPESDEVDIIRKAFDFGGTSHWEEGKNVLKRLPQAQVSSELDNALQRMSRWRDSAASGRSKPGIDDKVLIGWTALAVTGLAKAGRAFSEPAWIDRAVRGGLFLLNLARIPGRTDLLRRTWHTKGGPETEGFAEDYAFTIEALLTLHQTTLAPKWRDEARALMATALDRFLDESGTSFWFTAKDGESLFARNRSVEDSVLPSANAVMAANLWKLGWAYDIPKWRDMAQTMVNQRLANVTNLSHATVWADAALNMALPYATIAVAAKNQDELELAIGTWHEAPCKGCWVDGTTPDTVNKPKWMENKTPSSTGATQWYVCVDGACGIPCDSAGEAQRQVQSWRQASNNSGGPHGLR